MAETDVYMLSRALKGWYDMIKNLINFCFWCNSLYLYVYIFHDRSLWKALRPWLAEYLKRMIYIKH